MLDESLKTKKNFEKYLDETIDILTLSGTYAFAAEELKKMKERVIIQRHYKGWEREKIYRAMINRFNITGSLPLAIERGCCQENEFTQRIQNASEGLYNYEFYP